MIGGQWKCEVYGCDYSCNSLDDLDAHRERQHPREHQQRQQLLENPEVDPSA